MNIHSPIKFNRLYLHRCLLKFTPNIDDPRRILEGAKLNKKEFSKHVSSIRINNIWRTTSPVRHPLSDDLILNLMSEKKDGVVLDIGVSDGSTSLNIIERLGDNFNKYYITDMCFKIHYLENSGATYFYSDTTKECFMIITDKFVIYADKKNLLFPLKWISNFILSRAPKYDERSVKVISLCQPNLLNMAKGNPRIVILEWNMFNPWKYEKVDLIKIANVLNRSYFSDNEILTAIESLKKILKPNGKLLVVENRVVEQWSLFAKKGSSFRLANDDNGGCDISSLVENA